MTSFDAADMGIGDDYGHPEHVVERPRSIGRRPADTGRLRAAPDESPTWSETAGLTLLNRAVGRANPVKVVRLD
jgi:hypothetical protein